MSSNELPLLAEVLAKNQQGVLLDWLAALKESGANLSGRVNEAELRVQADAFLTALRPALASGERDARATPYAAARDLLADLSRSRALQGFTPRETALFVLSLKRPFQAAWTAHAPSHTTLAQVGWALSELLDELSLYTLDVYQKRREEVIVRQQQEISELSTPVIKLWNGILAVPLIGTLDSQRTQVVMENLLDAIVAQAAEIAIIDITGVPTVDTLTAQHLLKTIAAARLMGADCIISGIRPQIAQTMVHLGVELSVISKATLADAFSLALARIGRTVTRVRPTLGADAGAAKAS